MAQVHVKVAKGDPAKQPPEFFRGFDVCVLFGRPFKDQVRGRTPFRPSSSVRRRADGGGAQTSGDLLQPPPQVAVNAACRAAGVRFLAANCRSAYGIVFMDLLEHTCQARLPAFSRRTRRRRAAAPPRARSAQGRERLRGASANARASVRPSVCDVQDAKQSTDPEKPAPPPVKVEQSYPPLVVRAGSAGRPGEGAG